jgi:hypothetical protein
MIHKFGSPYQQSGQTVRLYVHKGMASSNSKGNLIHIYMRMGNSKRKLLN